MMRMQRRIQVGWEHRLVFTHDVLSHANATLAAHCEPGGDAARLLAFIDQGVMNAHPGLKQALSAYFDAHAARAPELVGVEVVPGGERAKNDPLVLNQVIDAIDARHIDRWSYVLAVGGGAVLDAVGFAAATVHRGVRIVRLPTTTLAQADSAIGVKCGVNHRGRKNLLGAFAVPHAVVCDPMLCRTLDDDEWRCGFAEAVKVALIRDAELFARIESDAPRIAARQEQASFPVIERSAALHLLHIAEGGDPFESGSARPLDMGHWAAHKLEQMTGFALRHGDAVAVGLAIDLAYAARVGLMRGDAVDRVMRVLGELGFGLAHEALNDVEVLMAGLDEFREHLGGPLTLVMPAGIGRTQNVHAIDGPAMREAIRGVAALS